MKIKHTVPTFAAVMLITYLLSYGYWEHRKYIYWSCRAINGPQLLDQGCILKPDGPLGVLLFVLIPGGVVLLFAVVLLVNRRAKK